MLRLFIETSNLDFQVALHDGSSFLYRSDQAEAGQPRDLSNLLEEGLNQSGKTVSDISEIIVDIGPGGLTSTRSGIAFANGLAFALNINIVAANGLELMRLQARSIILSKSSYKWTHLRSCSFVVVLLLA